jgi:hypothetical protein
MNYLSLAWQIPAVFTAVPMLARLWPTTLAPRAIPLFYFLVSLAVMAMPDRINFALAAAGLVTLLHSKVGLRLGGEEPPDLRAAAAKLRSAYAVTAYLLSSGYDQLALLAGRLSGYTPTIHDVPEDGKPEDGEPGKDYQEPPPAPPDRVPKHIPEL